MKLEIEKEKIDKINFERDLIEFFKTHFEDNLNLGVALLQGNKFIYINKRMHEIGGYSNKDTDKWTFNDYLSCVYEQDRSKVITQIRKKSFKSFGIPKF